MLWNIQRLEFIANTYGSGSLPLKFQADVLKLCWVCAPQRNVIHQFT